ncbi:hypothetical protein Bca52824_027221 [Brassica carinata]|uniref:DUF4283 domain-containing protein n=1 Tax=Brassica carinata TaxID=52824 RepID=A0A8X7SJA4_BRACI|nr:hypothetical protein Bca52824_027221 [Brassica carinata]
MSGDRNGETKVLNLEDQDATMMDVGERARPPGEPSDKVTTWASKAAGTMEGGMPIPEVLIDDGFVSRRLRVEFPNGEDGEPSITIENEVLEAMNGMWKQCMIVRVLGRNVPISALSRKLRELWNPKGLMYVMDLLRQFFMVRFEKEAEYLEALTGGPWRAFGSYLMVRAWSPKFDPLRDNIVTTPVWIRLTNIPMNFYHRSFLMGIAKGMGKPIRVDQTTLKFERTRYARICVEVNLAKPLKGTVLINGERYFVAYEGLSEICSKCGLYGHLVHGCPITIAERAAALTLQKEVSATVEIASKQGSPGQEEGFTQARGSRKGVFQSSRPVSDMTKSLNEEVNRSVRRTQNDKETTRIVLSNKYGSIGTDTNKDGSSEDGIPGEEDKENQKVNIQKENLVFGGNGGTSSNGGHKERWNGNKKTMEGGRGKPKKLDNRPVRGLVFGPTKGERTLSESGKRLRVESSDAGRPGGVFGDNVGVRDSPRSLKLRDEALENPVEITRSETEMQMVEAQTKLREEEEVGSLT